jgi:hypothetical protein
MQSGVIGVLAGQSHERIFNDATLDLFCSQGIAQLCHLGYGHPLVIRQNSSCSPVQLLAQLSYNSLLLGSFQSIAILLSSAGALSFLIEQRFNTACQRS